MASRQEAGLRIVNLSVLTLLLVQSYLVTQRNFGAILAEDLPQSIATILESISIHHDEMYMINVDRGK